MRMGRKEECVVKVLRSYRNRVTILFVTLMTQVIVYFVVKFKMVEDMCM